MSAKHQVLMNEHNNGYMAQGPYNVSTSRASDADAKPDLNEAFSSNVSGPRTIPW